MQTRCEYLITGAVGCATVNGRPLHLPGLLPGETGEYQALFERRGHLEATDLHRIDSVPERIASACPYSGICGGCDFDYVDEEHSALFKSAIVKANIEKATGRDISDVMMAPLYASSSGYRSRCRIHVSMKDRRIGFLAKRSNELVEVGRCPMLTQRLNDILADPRGLFTRAQSHLFSSGVNRRTGFVELSLFDADDKVLIAGEEGVKTVGPYRFHLSAGVFFQSNAVLLPRLFETVKRNVVGSRVMDLYSGVGTFSTILEGEGLEVVAVERDRQCLSFARRNAPSAMFFTDDVALWSKKARGGVDTVIVDPPRTGLGQAAHTIASWSADRVIYVSCNSATLANDLKAFDGYDIRSVQVIDFYPGTGHEESVVVMDRR